MYKLIVCDLDETLLNEEKLICEKNIIAIKKAIKKGVKFVPATGRGYTSVDSILNTLDLNDKADEYTISNNGAIITENKDFRELSFHRLLNSTVDKIVQFGFAHNICIQVFTAKDVYAFNLNDEERKWIFSFKKDAVVCTENNIEFLQNRQIVKVMFQSTDMLYLQSLKEKLSDEIKNETTITYSSNRYMEFTSKGINKGVAVKELANLLNIKLDEVMAIGDNHNDVTMLEVAGLSVAVGNAINEVKELCQFTSSLTSGEGAVGDAIDSFILNI